MADFEKIMTLEEFDYAMVNEGKIPGGKFGGRDKITIHFFFNWGET